MIPTYDQHDADYFNSHCASCGKRDRKIRFIYCGECFHPYVLGRLGLILHDVKVRIQINWTRPEYEWFSDWSGQDKWKFRFKSLIPHRFKNIWSCPCCVHDL